LAECDEKNTYSDFGIDDVSDAADDDDEVKYVPRVSEIALHRHHDHHHHQQQQQQQPIAIA